jgi:hypothetical protein
MQGFLPTRYAGFPSHTLCRVPFPPVMQGFLPTRYAGFPSHPLCRVSFPPVMQGVLPTRYAGFSFPPPHPLHPIPLFRVFFLSTPLTTSHQCSRSRFAKIRNFLLDPELESNLLSFSIYTFLLPVLYFLIATTQFSSLDTFAFCLYLLMYFINTYDSILFFLHHFCSLYTVLKDSGHYRIYREVSRG